MSSRELKLQTDIIKSVRRDGGYARKMSNRFAIGVPDLLIALPPFAPILAEVKDLGPVVSKFHRKLNVTDKQSHELKLFSEPYENFQTRYTPSRYSGILLVGFVQNGEHRLVALPRHAEALGAGYEEAGWAWRKRMPGLYYEMKPLLEAVGAIQVRTM